MLSTYVGRGEWAVARRKGMVGSEIEVPALVRVEQPEGVLARRQEAFDVRATLQDVSEDGALGWLIEMYQPEDRRTIRKCLAVADAAVGLSVDQRAARVTALHVASDPADLG